MVGYELLWKCKSQEWHRCKDGRSFVVKRDDDDDEAESIYT